MLSTLRDYFLRYKYKRISAAEEHGYQRQWYLLCGRADKASLLNPQPETLTRIVPPIDRIWADPFLWKKDGRFYIFCEEWIQGNPHGHISVIELDETLAPSSSRQIIVE